MKGVVLCGGEGVRLRPLTYYFQKVMIPVGNRPILEFTIRRLERFEIRDIVLLVKYKAKQIENYFDDGSKFNVKLHYAQDRPAVKGNGGALLDAYERGFLRRDDELLIHYGDILSDLNIRAMQDHHNNADVTLALARNYKVQVGVATVQDQRVIRLVEKPLLELPVSIGILILDGKMLDELSDYAKNLEEVDLMRHLMSHLIEKGRLVRAYFHDSFWCDLGSMEQYEKLDQSIAERLLRT